jgi:hypothetical protein
MGEETSKTELICLETSVTELPFYYCTHVTFLSINSSPSVSTNASETCVVS